MSTPPSTESTAPSATSPGHIPYFDAGSFLGEWPSRRVNGTPPPAREALVSQRLALMDRLGIQRAAVSLLEGVFLKDSGVANAELHSLVASDPASRDRFFPVYTINPTFPTWHEHLERCLAEYGLKPGSGAIRLLPAYHGYPLDAAGPLLERLTTVDVPVVLTIQLEDTRMHHPAIRVPDVPPAAVVAAIQRWPGVRWTVSNCVYNQVTAIGRDLPEDARVWFDLARVQGPVDCIRLLREQLGSHRLLFSTNLPLHVPHSPIMELADARLPIAEDTLIRHGNAREALGMER